MNPLALEIITLYRGTVLDVCHLAPGQRFTLGPDDADLPIDHPALVDRRPYAVAAMDADGRARIDPVPGSSTTVLIEGAVHPVDGARGVRLVPGQKARVDLGEIALLFALVPRAAEVARAPVGLLDRQGRRYLGIAAVMHAALLALAFAVPVQAGGLNMDGFDMGDRWVEFDSTPIEDQTEDWTDGIVEQPADAVDAQVVDSAPTWIDRKPEPTGDAGKTAAGTDEDVAAARKAEAREAATELASALDGLVPDLGARTHGALADLNGNVHGAGNGFGGGDRLDMFGGPGLKPGPSGGPSADVGPLKTRTGKGKDPYGRAPGGAKIPKKPKTPPQMIALKPEVSEGLSRDDIQRVIRNHRKEILYCYERKLQVERGIEGKVRMFFLIGPGGEVLGVSTQETTLGDGEVEACMRQRIKGWTFPPVRGGGTVKVTYPFIFRSST